MPKITKKLSVKLWTHLLKNSHYFTYQQKKRGIFKTIYGALATKMIRLIERHYRKYFLRFDQHIKKLSQKKSTGRGLLFVMGALNPGGAERQAVLLLQQLKQRGENLLGLIAFYLNSDRNRFYLPQLLSHNINVETLQPTTTVQVPKAIDLLPKRLRPIANYLEPIARHNPKIVHLWLDEINLKAGIAAVLLGIPKIVLSTRNAPPAHFLFYQPYMREAYRLLAKQPNVVLLNNSEYGARAYEKWLHLPEGLIKVIHNGFDFNPTVLQSAIRHRLAYRQNANMPEEAQLIGTVMRLNEEKRPLLWIEIAARIHNQLPHTHFLMIGDGPLKKAVTDRIEALPFGPHFHLIHEEKQSLTAIAAMDLFLLTSRMEGLPNVLIEAQAVNVPVVTTRAGGAAETLLPGETGWILTHDQPDEAAHTLIKLLQDQEGLKKAALLSHDYVQQRFDVEKMLAKMLAIYGDAS